MQFKVKERKERNNDDACDECNIKMPHTKFIIIDHNKRPVINPDKYPIRPGKGDGDKE